MALSHAKNISHLRETLEIIVSFVAQHKAILKLAGKLSFFSDKQINALKTRN